MKQNDYGLPEEITAQSLFDKSARHLLEMTEACAQNDHEFGGFMCRYRDGAGNACAIGCLISDDDYNPDIETRNVKCIINSKDSFIISEAPKVLPSSIWPHLDMLNALQEAHDRTKNRFPDSKMFIPGAMRANLKRIAKDLGLNTQVLDDGVEDVI